MTMEVITRHLGELQGKANYLNVAVGTKIKGGKDTGIRAIVVYVSSKRAPVHVLPKDMVPSDIEGVPTDVATFAIDLKARLATGLDSSRLWVETPGKRPIALADHDRLERILTNLWSNALKYSGGQVAVRVERSAGEVTVAVSDHGHPEETAYLRMVGGVADRAGIRGDIRDA